MRSAMFSGPVMGKSDRLCTFYAEDGAITTVEGLIKSSLRRRNG